MEVRRLALRPRSSLEGGSWGHAASAVVVAVAVALVGGGGATLASACGTGAVDVAGCRQIEEARCRQAPACRIPIEPPYFTSESNVDACIRFYDDACLHGLAASDPGAAAVSACVAAIQNDSIKKDGCGVVKSPQSDQAACGWLVPPANAPVDASDSQAADVASQ